MFARMFFQLIDLVFVELDGCKHLLLLLCLRFDAITLFLCIDLLSSIIQVWSEVLANNMWNEL